MPPVRALVLVVAGTIDEHRATCPRLWGKVGQRWSCWAVGPPTGVRFCRRQCLPLEWPVPGVSGALRSAAEPTAGHSCERDIAESVKARMHSGN